MEKRKCKKCGEEIPLKAWINGKKHNLQSRKYCFTCSPFGEHNTSQLETIRIIKSRLENRERIKKIRICPSCGKEHVQGAKTCFVCYFNKRQIAVKDRIISIVGDSCWFCGYNRTWRNICFHHLDPSIKKFDLTTREMMLKWERVFTEMQKCVVCCHNCHGEIHQDLINKSVVEEIWKTKWAQILAKLDTQTELVA